MSELHRTGRSNPFGKNTEEVKTAIDEETKEALTALAFAAGITPAEYLRDLIHQHVYGHAHMLRVALRKPGRNVG